MIRLNKLKNNEKKKKFLTVIVLFACVVVVLFFTGAIIKKATIYSGFKNYRAKIIKYSKKFDLEPELTLAIIRAESGFDCKAVSDKGACGLMQLMPETAKYAAELVGYEKQINLFDPDCNVYLGCAYLKYLFKRFKNEKNVICAYNAGEGRVSSWLSSEKNDGELKQIHFDETKNYYERVLYYKVKYRRFLNSRKRIAKKTLYERKFN